MTRPHPSRSACSVEVLTLTCDNKNAAPERWNSRRPLTHSSDYGREGLAMQATRKLPSAHKPKDPLVIPGEVALRALSRWTLEAPTGCYISTYSTASHGYAQIGWQERTATSRTRGTLCHRAAWTAVYGQIPEGMTIDHLCKNRQCVNVEHLRLLTNYENARRTAGRDWPLGQCVNGHSDEHLANIAGRWNCRICAGDWQRTHRARKAVSA